jgi:hypothetical protein
MEPSEAIGTSGQPPQGVLRLPKGTLFIDYDRPAEAYFDYETTPRDAYSRLKFLGSVSKVRIGKAKDILPSSPENLQAVGIGRKSLSQLVDNVLMCEEKRFQILDGAPTVTESQHFKFDDFDIVFADSDMDIYQNTVWSQAVEENGRVQAYINDIKTYCKVNDKYVTDAHIEAKLSEGGIGWFLGALLLKLSISQGKLELQIPTLSS